MRALVFLPLVLALASACPKTIEKIDTADAGTTTTISCNSNADCPEANPDCSFGVCKRPCAGNDACNDASTYCNVVDGYCEQGCRDSSTCASGEVCSAGACIVGSGCGSNCDCQVGETCTNGSCTAPPQACNNSDDCPKGNTTCQQYSCNGFTHQCFDPAPAPCTSDVDCQGRLGCEGGCTCVTDTQQCASGVQCTEQNESTTCPANFYCSGGTCQAAPGCTSDAQCTSSGLVCNTGSGVCERSQACASSADCTTSPNTFCTNAGRCGIALCNNGGPACTGGQTCAADGRCVTQGTGGPCTSNNDCQQNEYCAFVNNTGSCAVGCRDNTSCDQTAGQSCNGSHQCIGGGGGNLQPWQGTCSQTSDCQAGLFCGVFTHTCQEACSTEGPCTGGSCCTLSGAQCCTNAIVDICSNTGC